MKIEGYEKSSCYARELGNCSTKITGEHYISKVLLAKIATSNKKNPLIKVTNLSFQEPGKQQFFSINSLTANILCKSHNEELSSLDEVGGIFFDAVKDLHLSLRDPDRQSEKFRISGRSLERFLLKCLIGGLHGGAICPPDMSHKGSKPPPLQLIQMLFDLEPMQQPMGLYLLSPKKGQVVTTDECAFQLQPIRDAINGGIIGGKFAFLNCEFILFTSIPSPDHPFAFEDLPYRPSRICDQHMTTEILFDWEDQYHGENIIFKRVMPDGGDYSSDCSNITG